ncbi:hypothetical protein SBA5_550034 [Candidatus Sulfotelmatomonas gaucii]|uniref:Uncharacterized protein n=1 Tax=Candidatus Sulfuritelmatomonas gaucii TaxID=2043161 RepID=A0A2N9LTP6_9BACT|nr:hypothetical protein SBA5_550034 [Candidatus Sulfotelmatomonas gaucii]
MVNLSFRRGSSYGSPVRHFIAPTNAHTIAKRVGSVNFPSSVIRDDWPEFAVFYLTGSERSGPKVRGDTELPRMPIDGSPRKAQPEEKQRNGGQRRLAWARHERCA